MCELVELPRAVVEADRRPCTCGGTTWYEVGPCAHAGMRVVNRQGQLEQWCPTCGWSAGGVFSGRGAAAHATPTYFLHDDVVTCPHYGGSWCAYCGAVKDETETRGYAGPVWECPVDAQRRTNLRALTDKPSETTNIGPNRESVSRDAARQRKAFVRVRPMLPPIGESAPVCAACDPGGVAENVARHRCTFFAPSETSILCGKWLCAEHAGHAIEGGAVLCPEHLPVARALLARRKDPHHG